MQNPAFVQDFTRRVPMWRLPWFFVTHPRQAYATAIAALDEGGRQRPPMGNYDRNAGFPHSTESQSFAFWSNLKRKLFHGQGARYLAALVAVSGLLVTLALWRRKHIPQAAFWGILTLVAMGLASLAISSLADAAEVARHYLICSALYDLQLLAAVGLTVPSKR
jgi:hypothetical protein